MSTTASGHAVEQQAREWPPEGLRRVPYWAYQDPAIDLDTKLSRFSTALLDLHFQIRDLMFGSLENLRGRELQDVYLKINQYIDRVVAFLSHILTVHGHTVTEVRAAAIGEFVLFLSGRFIVYILSHDWNSRQELYTLMPVWAVELFRPLVLPEALPQT